MDKNNDNVDIDMINDQRHLLKDYYEPDYMTPEEKSYGDPQDGDLDQCYRLVKAAKTPAFRKNTKRKEASATDTKVPEAVFPGEVLRDQVVDRQ